jgi:hypothetical protein
LNNARVFCRSLGLPTVDVRFYNAEYEAINKKDILKGLMYPSYAWNCTGTEDYLS